MIDKAYLGNLQREEAVMPTTWEIEEGSQTPEEKRSGQKILLIDDEAFFLQLGKNILEGKGYQVITAGSGAEGLEKAKKENPDAILLDVVMPEMDGFEACQKLKADPSTSQIPLLMLTATDDAKLNQKAFKAGADFTITKGSNPERLLNTLSLALAKRRPQK